MEAWTKKVTYEVDEESEAVLWSGECLTKYAIERLCRFEHSIQKKYPLMCLNTLLMQCK